MDLLNDLCCICLKFKKGLHKLSDMKDDITYFKKLTTAIPEMCFEELNKFGRICPECCVNLDIIYKFKAKCLQNRPHLFLNTSQPNPNRTIKTRTNGSINKLENFLKPETNTTFRETDASVEKHINCESKKPRNRQERPGYENMKNGKRNGHPNKSPYASKTNYNTSSKKQSVQNKKGNLAEKLTDIEDYQKICEKLLMADDVLGMKISITNLQDQVNEIRNLLLSHSTTEEEQEKRKESHIFFSSVFPLTNEDQLMKIENKVTTDNEFQMHLIYELSKLGGLSVDEHVSRILYKLLTNELACKYNWSGGKQKKKPFYNLALVDMINKAVLNNRKLKNVTHRDIQDSIKNWLRRCKEKSQKN